jgi:hypothetical protein
VISVTGLSVLSGTELFTKGQWFQRTFDPTAHGVRDTSALSVDPPLGGRREYDRNVSIRAIKCCPKGGLISFDVKDETGNVSHWVCEFGVLRELKAQGWTDNTLKSGDVVKVVVHPRKNGDHAGTLVGKITYADGRALALNPPKDQPNVPRPLHW